MPLNKFTAYIGTDKKLHGLYGSLAVLAGYIAGSILVMFFAPIVMGVSKELWDKYVRKTVFCWEDVFFTIVLGYFIAGVVLGISELIMML